MASDTYDTLDKYEFLGEFFEHQNSNTGRFAGKIKYSPENGLQLDFCISDSDSPLRCDRLFGVLNNGKKCTLIGSFDFQVTGKHYYGSILVKTGLHDFRYLILGDFFRQEAFFKFADFTFNGMQEFIYPQHRIKQLEYQDKSMIEVNAEEWSLEINNQATFSLVGRDLKNLVHFNDKKNKNDFDIMLEYIFQEYPLEHLRLRNTLEFIIRFLPSKPQTLEHLMDYVTKVTALFSILMDQPAFPSQIKLAIDNESNKQVSVLSSWILERRTVELACKATHHHLMPLNWSNLNMESVLKNWFKIYDEFQVLSVAHQYETGFRTLPFVHGEVVLYSTQLEAINLDLEGSQKARYSNPIQHYASSKLLSKFSDFFIQKGELDIGEAISKLRNEIAHVGRPKKLIKKLNIKDLIFINNMLRLVVVSHLFAKLDIPQDTIHKFQNHFI